MKTIHRSMKITAVIIIIAVLFISADNDRESLKFVNPGFSINSEGDDFSPSITADGNTLVFSSKKPEEKSHNIFICKKVKGVWSGPTPISELCTDSNEETPFISADGKTILFASDRPGGFLPPVTSDGNRRITFDIYLSRYGNGRWSDPELLSREINTTMNERTPSLSRDARLLFFSRWPYKNPGRSKIFMAELQNGRYVNAKELPESINSGNFEVAFIPSYRDNRYYFSSMRNGGYGGWDIYYTTKTGKGFTAPVNAGGVINSVSDDLCFAEAASDYVICKNIPGGLGGYDIYVSSRSARIQEPVSTGKTAYSKETKLRIRAADSLTGKLLKELPLRINLLTGADVEKSAGRSVEARTDSSGTFVIYPKKDVKWLSVEPLSPDYCDAGIKIKVLPEQYQDIALYLTRNPLEENISEEKKKTASGKSAPPELRAKDDNTFRSIHFDFGSAKIRTDDIPEIYRVVEYMRQNSTATLLLTGYADSVGSRKINIRISYARGMAVKKIITGMGIGCDRITVKGAGEIKPGLGKDIRSRRVDFSIR